MAELINHLTGRSCDDPKGLLADSIFNFSEDLKPSEDGYS